MSSAACGLVKAMGCPYCLTGNPATGAPALQPCIAEARYARIVRLKHDRRRPGPMPQPALFTNAPKSGSKEFSATPAFDKLQQLASQGYVTDPTPRGDGILLRHPSGPDLVLRP